MVKMSKPLKKDYGYDITESGDGSVTLQIHGNLNASNSGSMIREIEPILQERLPASLTVDLKDVGYMDDYGVLVLAEMKEIIIKGRGGFHLRNAGEKSQRHTYCPGL